jgi:hypothetical protein
MFAGGGEKVRETGAARDRRKEIYASPRRYERDLHGSIRRPPRLVGRKTEKQRKRERERERERKRPSSGT